MLSRHLYQCLLACTLVSLLPVSVAVAKETSEDRPVGTLGGAVHADPFTGVATTSIPIEVPPGRNGMQPNLALTYNSANGNGWLGMGWELAQEGIYRQTKWGVDYNNNTGEKAFVVKMAGVTGELVPTPPPTPSNQWSAKIEGGFSRIEKLTAGDGQIMWKVTTKQGRKHYFGQTSASRQVDPANAGRIFGWLLDRVEDLDGNYMTYSYWTDTENNQVYLDRIEYSGNSSTGALSINTVKFWRDDGSRPDQADMYTTNYRVKNRYRVKTIEIKANGNLMWAYKLAFITSEASSRTLLSTLQRFGRNTALDASGTITAGNELPSVSNSYASGGSGFTKVSWATDADGMVMDGQTYVLPGDFNGDGKIDIAMTRPTWNGFRLRISNGNSFISAWWATDADGMALDGQTYILPGDFNGDGKTDIALLRPDWSGFRLRLSNGNGFTSAWWETGWNGMWADGHTYVLPGDFNGDGKTDIALTRPTWNAFRVHLSSGNSFITSSWATDADGMALDGQTYVRADDFDGDGKTDIALTRPTWNGFRVRLSKGDSFTSLWWGTSADGMVMDGQTYLLTGDFDGNGKADITYTRPTWNSFSVVLSNGSIADILYTHTTALGGATTITYAPSTQWPSTQLPFPMQRVSAIATCDNWDSTTSTCNTTPSTTTYSYSGGFYHPGERDLRGVAQVTVTGPADASGQRTITETYFHQGSKATPVGETLAELQADTKAYTKGQPYRVVVKDQTGTVQSEILTEYYDDLIDGTIQAAPFFTPVKDILSKLYTGGAVSKETKVAYTYGESPQYGNVTREDHYSDATNNNAVTSDDKTIVRTYGNNTTDWLIGFPISEIIYAGIGTTNRVAQTDLYYDGTSSCSTASTNQVPTKGHLTRSVRHFFNGTSPHGNPEIRFAYDSSGNRTCSRDGRGNTTTIAYDSTGTFALSTTTPSPASLTTTTAYYGVGGIPMDTGLYGQVKSVTDPNGRVTSHEYDALGRKTKTTNPDGFFATVTYNYGNGQTVGTQHVLTSNSLGHSTATYFDGLGRTIRKTSTYTGGPTRETKTEYDVRGQVFRSSLPYFTGGTVYWRTPSYDALGRVTQVMNPDNTVSKSCYADWTTVTLEADGDRKRETKDAAGRVVTIDEYNATVTTCDTAVGTPFATTNYVYDVLGNLTSVTDAKGNVSTMAYDSLGRKVSMHDPDMGNWSYLYDENGNLIKQTDAKDQILWFQYDELNRRRQKDFTTQKALGSGDVKYTYDDSVTTTNRKGRLKQVQDAATDVTFEYDVLGRITKSTKILDGTTYITTSAYDGLGRLTSVSYPSTPAKSVDYLYVGPYLEQVKDKPGDGTVTYVQYAGWNEMGQPATATYNVGANQVVTTYTYQTGDNTTCLNKHTFRPCTTKTQKGTNPAYLDLRYVFTNGGNVQTLVDAINGNQDFSYDALDRLTMATGPYGAGGATTTLSYDYDEIGNLTFTTQVGAYAYPTSGASSVHPHAVTTAGSHTYAYDNNGNMTSGAGRTFTWNLENKPLTITQAGQTTTFVYDGDGGRVKKLVGTTTTRYISKLYECDNTNCTRYIYAGSARVATVASNGAIHFWHPDHLGSSTVITDSTGAKVQALTYYPYGATRTSQSFTTPAIDVPYKYTGKELDSSTGLYYYEARYYDSELGRFISADTIVPNPRDPQSLNRYSYVRNNPLIYTDPTGHFFKKFFKQVFKNPIIRGVAWAVVPYYMPYFDPSTSNVAITQSVRAAVTWFTGGSCGTCVNAITGAVGALLAQSDGQQANILKATAKGALSGGLDDVFGLTGLTTYCPFCSGAIKGAALALYSQAVEGKRSNILRSALAEGAKSTIEALGDKLADANLGTMTPVGEPAKILGQIGGGVVSAAITRENVLREAISAGAEWAIGAGYDVVGQQMASTPGAADDIWAGNDDLQMFQSPSREELLSRKVVRGLVVGVSINSTSGVLERSIHGR